MVQTEGFPDHHQDLLARLGLQFFDLERWPEEDILYPAYYVANDLEGKTFVFINGVGYPVNDFMVTFEKTTKQLTESFKSLTANMTELVRAAEPCVEKPSKTGPKLDHFRKRGKDFKR